ncbi:putative CitXG protein, includes Apo-citrate lyase phosphoribosyl-dephospho-CoA transferase (citX) [Oenococcus oeni]|uniref:citrate lyase holo-[acyl-carrier protein] synthase n=1 Tax=Oenococcus oeni TaxID=1247 RepID=UPI0010B41E68|nr:citrate lyase holo-[acyl-carrier protein] synthase [Oenococcus oeni]SYW01251.1 putative CitXG protein, includes Apo-citrate lyase phosphoribosyl-dephospho-CoA transferase (citX) [Oenococcus oeni]
MIMENIFSSGEKQQIADVLANKDDRAALQKQILEKHPEDCLLAVKLNIPGPIKNNSRLKSLFEKGIDQLEKELKLSNFKIIAVKSWDKGTGCENFYLIKNTAANVKKTAVLFEDKNDLGRLFDADVLTNKKGIISSLSRKQLKQNSRKCLICQRPAKECARSRRHTIKELQDRISEIYEESFQ